MLNGIRTGWNDLDRTFAELDAMRRHVDAYFDAIEPATRRRPQHAVGWSAWPDADLYDAGEAFVVEADLPGVAEDAIELQVTGTALTLAGKRPVQAPEGYAAHRRERRGYEFSRSFAFPVKVDPEKATATMKNGVLTVRLPKAAEVQPRKITVQS